MRRVLSVPVVDWGWLMALALWRLFISTKHGLGVDEAHYVLYGMRLDWSYFDHPPLTGWVEALFYFLLGKHEWVARLPAIICGFISSLFVFRLTEKISHLETGARWATVALNASFLPVALWIMFLPDTLLFVLVLWLVNIILKILDEQKTFHWIELGLCLGLCGLSKYTAIFLLISLIGIFLTKRAWSKIKIKGLALGFVIAVVCIIPVFYWNLRHNWISFTYQQSHVMGQHHLHFKDFFVFLTTQLLAFSPFLIVPSAYWFYRTRHSWEKEVRVALWVALPPLFFFAYTSLKDEVLPHWTIIGWGLFIPTGIALGLRENICRKTKLSIGVSLALLLFALLELSFQFLKLPAYQSPYADLMGWPSLHDDIQKILAHEKPNTYSIGVPNWTLGSRANYYLEDLAKVYVLDNRFDQFDLWEGGPPQTPNILILEWRGFQLDADKASKCQKIELVKEKVFEIHGSPVNSVKISWCRGYQFISQPMLKSNPMVK